MESRRILVEGLREFTEHYTPNGRRHGLSNTEWVTVVNYETRGVDFFEAMQQAREFWEWDQGIDTSGLTLRCSFA